VLQVGGRVLAGEHGWQLADAFAALDVELQQGSTPRAAALVVVRGTLRGRSLVGAELLEEQPPDPGSAPLEFERLHHGAVGARLRLRARVLNEVRGFFQDAGFLEVDTPIRTPECSSEPNIEPLEAGSSHLITSPELHMKRLLVAGVPQLFQLVHCFRAEELGPWHAPEFLMLEWYRAFADWEQVLLDTERLLARSCEAIRGVTSIELSNGRSIDLRPPFLRLSVREAFARFAGVADAAELAARDEDQYFQLLVDRVEPALAGYAQPVFLYDYPSSQAALARRKPADPSVAERFELYVAGVELCNGYGELNDAAEQRRRCELDQERRRSLGRPVPGWPERFLAALDQGMPRASGNALGLDRWIALLAGQDRIEDVCPFPAAFV
jgi:lysyl-tRNA synthetase class 2